MKMKLFVCVVMLILCPACQSIRRDSQYNNRPKAAISESVSAEIAGIISLSLSRCIIYDTKTVLAKQNTDSIVIKYTEHL